MDACLLGRHPSGRILFIARASAAALILQDRKIKVLPGIIAVSVPFDMNPPQLPGPFHIEERSVRGVQVVTFLLSKQFPESEKSSLF